MTDAQTVLRLDQKKTKLTEFLRRQSNKQKLGLPVNYHLSDNPSACLRIHSFCNSKHFQLNNSLSN